MPIKKVFYILQIVLIEEISAKADNYCLWIAGRQTEVLCLSVSSI